MDRATAIEKIREERPAEKLEKKEARVDLYIRCYWVAVLLGGWTPESQVSRSETNALAFSVLRLLPVLLERDRATNTWRVIPAHAEKAGALWARAVSEHLSAAAVDQELSKILPARTVPLRKHRPVRLSVIERLLSRLRPEDLPKVHGLVDQVRAKAQAKDSAA